MASVLYQSIELLSQEKSIDPAIVVGAVEEAIALATRKFYKTQENMRGELDKETGEIHGLHLQDGGGRRRSPRGSAQPDHPHRGQETGAGGGGGQRDPALSRHQSAGPHRRATGQAGHLPESPRGRARNRLQRVRPPRKRSAQRHRQAPRGPGRDLRPGQGRSPLPQARAVAPGAVLHRRARPRRSAQGGPRRQRAAGDRLPRRPRAGAESLSVRSSRNLRRHGGHPRHRPRGRRAHQDRRPDPATRMWTPSAPAWA